MKCSATTPLTANAHLNCLLWTGHHGPHRDSGWPVLWSGISALKRWNEESPEPKPWHDAKEGEVWLVTYNGEQYPAIFQADQFRDHGGSWTADDITDARRIYPEDPS